MCPHHDSNESRSSEADVLLLLLFQVFADDLTNCKVYIGACGADVFIRNCTNCTFTIACKQLRMRDCSHDKIYLYSTTRPALEASHHMELAPFNGSYPRQKIHFKQAGLNPE